VKTDLSIDPGRAALVATPISVALLAAVVLPHQLLYRQNALKVLYLELGGWGFAAAVVGGIVVHEAIHAVTWLAIGGLRPGEIVFGIQWRVLMPYAHPSRPISARAYAVGAAMPGIVLGLLPAGVGLGWGRGAWSGFGAVFLAAAGGDLLVLFSLRGVSGGELVRDHPVRVGCERCDTSDELGRA
jgi:hypothetical protein